MILTGTQGRRVKALDVPYERDRLALAAIAEGGVQLSTIAECYGVHHESIRLAARKAERRFRARWRLMYGTEPPDLVRRDWRGMEVA
jgi:hypothetical protein